MSDKFMPAPKIIDKHKRIAQMALLRRFVAKRRNSAPDNSEIKISMIQKECEIDFMNREKLLLENSVTNEEPRFAE